MTTFEHCDGSKFPREGSLTFEEAKDQVAKEQGLDKFPKLPAPYQVLYEKTAELYATAKAAQETETLKREIQAYELTVQNLRNGLAQAWEEGYTAANDDMSDLNDSTNPYKQEKP
jgi:hypothetical protein